MYKLENYEIRTSLSEITIEEFDKISVILNDQSLMSIEKYLDVLDVLKVPSHIIDDLSSEELLAIIQDFSKYKYKDNLEQIIELDGFVYKAWETEPKLKARDMALIEQGIKEQKSFMTNLISVIFKKEGLTNKEHWEPAHIKHKMSLFKGLNAADYYPYVVWVSKKIINRIETAVDNSEIKEQDGI
jgi:hypothetical protein